MDYICCRSFKLSINYNICDNFGLGFDWVFVGISSAVAARVPRIVKWRKKLGHVKSIWPAAYLECQVLLICSAWTREKVSSFITGKSSRMRDKVVTFVIGSSFSLPRGAAFPC